MAATARQNGAAQTATRDTFSELMSREVSFTPLGEANPIRLSIDLCRTMGIARPTKSGAVPDDQTVIGFVKLCEARMLNPFAGDAWLLGYDTRDGPQFSVVTSIQSMLKRAELSKEYDGKQDGVIVMNQADKTIHELEGDFIPDGHKLIGGWAKVYRKDRKFPDVQRVNLSARDKGRSLWTTDPAGMISKCALAAALRDAFPSTMGQVYLEHEVGEGHQARPTENPSSEQQKVLSESDVLRAKLLANVNAITNTVDEKRGDPMTRLSKLLAEVSKPECQSFMVELTDAVQAKAYAICWESLETADGDDAIAAAVVKCGKAHQAGLVTNEQHAAVMGHGKLRKQDG